MYNNKFNINVKNIYEELNINTYLTTWFKRICDRLELKEEVDYVIKYPFEDAKFYRATVFVNEETKRLIYKLYKKDYLLNNIKEKAIIDQPIQDMIEEDKKTNKIKELNKDNKLLKTEVIKMNEVISNMYESMLSQNEINKLNNTNYTIVEKDDTYITPVLCLADIHYGQVVKKSYVYGYNEYNSDICEKRLNYCVDKFIHHYKDMQNYKIKEIVIYFGGDDIANDMHGQPIDKTIPEMIIGISRIYIQILNKIKQNFKNTKLNIVFVSSNHNRINADYEYTPNFNCITNSYTYLIMNNIINAGFELLWDDSGSYFMNVNGKRILFEHGHNIKINTNSHNSIITALNKKNKQFLSLDKNEFDLLLLCHYHAPYITDKVIICSSLVGMDNYSKSLNLPAYKPGVTTFSISDKGELTNYKVITTDI